MTVIGKLQIQYEDTTGEKFTETPFYICGNPYLSDGAAASINRRIHTALAQVDQLANNIKINAKMIYEFNLYAPD